MGPCNSIWFYFSSFLSGQQHCVCMMPTVVSTFYPLKAGCCHDVAWFDLSHSCSYVASGKIFVISNGAQ